VNRFDEAGSATAGRVEVEMGHMLAGVWAARHEVCRPVRVTRLRLRLPVLLPARRLYALHFRVRPSFPRSAEVMEMRYSSGEPGGVRAASRRSAQRSRNKSEIRCRNKRAERKCFAR